MYSRNSKNNLGNPTEKSFNTMTLVRGSGKHNNTNSSVKDKSAQKQTPSKNRESSKAKDLGGNMKAIKHYMQEIENT